ncbi:hypothetical protein [Aedoeadaptatus coxii]
MHWALENVRKREQKRMTVPKERTKRMSLLLMRLQKLVR